MNPPTPVDADAQSPDRVHARLEALEAKLTGLRLTVGVMFMISLLSLAGLGVLAAEVFLVGRVGSGSGSGAAVGFRADRTDTGEADRLMVRRLVILDAAGRNRIALGVGPDGTATFAMNDSEGRTRLALEQAEMGGRAPAEGSSAGRARGGTGDGTGVESDSDSESHSGSGSGSDSASGPVTLRAFDRSGVARFQAGLTGGATPFVFLADAGATPRWAAALDESGAPTNVWTDASGAGRASIALLEGGSPRLAMWNASRQLRLDLSQADARAGLSIWSDAGARRLNLQSDPKATGVELLDSRERNRSQWRLDDKGSGSIEFRDAAGNLFYYAP